jgi:hypothetical protein
VREITSLPIYNAGYYKWGQVRDITSLAIYNLTEIIYNIPVFMDGSAQVLSIMSPKNNRL